MRFQTASGLGLKSLALWASKIPVQCAKPSQATDLVWKLARLPSFVSTLGAHVCKIDAAVDIETGRSRDQETRAEVGACRSKKQNLFWNCFFEPSVDNPNPPDWNPTFSGRVSPDPLRCPLTGGRPKKSARGGESGGELKSWHGTEHGGRQGPP